MSQNEAKELLLRLKKEKKVSKQMELVEALKNYNEMGMVNHVLLIHLQRKDHDSLRLEILSAINPKFNEIIQPLIQITKDDTEPLPVKEKTVQLLGETRNKKAMKALLHTFKKTKSLTLKENILFALTHFYDKSVNKLLVKALKTDSFQIPILKGLAKNESILFASKELLLAILALEISSKFDSIHLEKIIEMLLTKFEENSTQSLLTALKANKLSKQLKNFQKEQKLKEHAFHKK